MVLSACETGLYDIDRNPDEFVGLPATFMQAGAAGVVGSLWLVDDLATALLMAKFYDLHLGGPKGSGPKGGLAPPTALRQAQAWLRDSTRMELAAYAKAAAKQAGIDRVKLAELHGRADARPALRVRAASRACGRRCRSRKRPRLYSRRSASARRL